MSLRKEKSIEVNYRRDSFSDRVCDDLCEVILQYLTLKDRIRLECVSKQFQRNVFLSQCSQYLEIPQKGLKSEQMEQLFKKFPKLKKIILGSRHEYNSRREQGHNDPEPYQELIKFCNNLTHIQFNNPLVDKETKEKLFGKFGHQLISIRYWPQNSWPTEVYGIASTNATNIEELTTAWFDSDLTQMKFNRLNKFRVYQLYEENVNEFEIFIENNAKTLKHLDISCDHMRDAINKESVIKLFKKFARAINLVHLGIESNVNITDNSLTKYWTEIAINCKQLKSLSIGLFKNEGLLINGEMLSILKQFKQLKRLEIKLWNRGSVAQMDDFRPFQELMGLEELTHLSIRGINSGFFKESILTDIDINLPKLKSLEINCEFNASKWTADVLRRLSNLETIGLRIRNREIIPEIEKQLIKNCKHFKSFVILSNNRN